MSSDATRTPQKVSGRAEGNRRKRQRYNERPTVQSNRAKKFEALYAELMIEKNALQDKVRELENCKVESKHDDIDDTTSGRCEFCEKLTTDSEKLTADNKKLHGAYKRLMFVYERMYNTLDPESQSKFPSPACN